MLTEGGLRVPFIIMGPDDYFLKKSVRNDIINMLDLSATTLAWAESKSPIGMKERIFLLIVLLLVNMLLRIKID